MASLADIADLAVTIRTAKTASIKLIHNFIFDTLGDRNNRGRLRTFVGFEFLIDSPEFTTKVADVQEKFSLTDLISIAHTLNVSPEGDLPTLALRLVTYLTDLEQLKENLIANDSDESDSETDVQSQISASGSQQNLEISQPIASSPKLAFGFSDVENSIVPYKGEIFQNVNHWLEEFEEIATMFRLDNLHKLVFARRCMQGRAKLFISGQRHITSWSAFKNLLRTEFASDYSSSEIHDLLRNRRIKHNESLDEYLLVMQNLSSHSDIDEASLVKYIIDGIEDSPRNKIVLYGSKTLAELKQKIKIYNEIRRSYQTTSFKHKDKVNTNDKYKRYASSDTRTRHQYNSTTDTSSENRTRYKSNVDSRQQVDQTPSKSKGPRCFRCNGYNHISYFCPKKPDSKPEKSAVNTVQSETLLLKAVKLSSLDLIALVDTGSQKTILKHSLFQRLHNFKLTTTNVTLTGLGNSAIKPVGCFNAALNIDGFDFFTDIYVIPDTALSFDLIIGIDIIRQGVLTIKDTEITLSKPPADSNNFLINVVNVVDDSLLDLSHISDEHLRSQLTTIIGHYKPLKTKSVDIKLKINLQDEIPIYSPPRRLPPCEKKIVEAQIDEWLANGIIRPSTSEYTSPIVLVRKKDNTTRLCIDYRRLNKKTVRDHFPLPLIDDVIDQLHAAKVFSTIDLKNGFFHVDVDESSRKYTAFVTHHGVWEYNQTPFGLCNSPAIFSKFIYNVFKPLIKAGIVIIYMDDLVIPSANEIEGLERLTIVLQTASEYGLDLNIKKCHFLKREINFLGYRIADGKLYPSADKTKAVINFPEPKCTKDLFSYLGLTSYFRRFIKQYSIIAKPLTDLLKKGVKFRFGAEERIAFNSLKNILASEPVLTLYNPQSETQVHCDASIDGYGAVLVQRSLADNQFHPVHYSSKKTSDAERKYSSYELEVLAVIEALKKFRIYILGIPFTIVTDCNAFKQTMDKKEMSAKIARWALMLSDFDYKVEHRRGISMKHVDALSRNPVCLIVENSVTLQVQKSQSIDEHIQALKTILDKQPYDDYLLKNDILYKCINGTDLLVIPESMQMSLIKSVHETGHFAIKRTLDSLKGLYYIPELQQKVEKCIQNCVPCIMINKKRGKQEGLLHPIKKPDLPLHTYHVDHLGPLDSTHKNYKHIFVVIDAFTKFVWLYPTKSTDTAEVLTKLEMQKSVFGNPTSIISDRHPCFTSTAFADYCATEQIQHTPITTGLCRSNGQAERIMAVIISVLAKLSIDNPQKWYTKVPVVQQAINSTFQRSINTTPFELLFGTKIKLNTDTNIIQLINSEMLAYFVDNRDALRQSAKQQILKVQHENQRTYNLRRKPARSFQLNDIVAIKRTQNSPGLKLKSKFLGPYRITKLKGHDSYDVERIGYTEGPMKTSSVAEFLKLWDSPD